MTASIPVTAGPRPAGADLRPAVVDGVDVDAVAAAVRRCAAVEDLCAGTWGGVVSYLPGRQVPGVRVAGAQVVISVRGGWGFPAAEIGRQIRAAVAALAGSRQVDVIVADVADRPAAAVADDQHDQGVSWLTNSAAGRRGAPSSGPATLTGAATPPPLPPV
jgi:hypothetical protein